MGCRCVEGVGRDATGDAVAHGCGRGAVRLAACLIFEAPQKLLAEYEAGKPVEDLES